ncbi:MAG: IPTL-CTERM sorting domain-containing protein [Burkholderiales bacterium]|nr:IPTL-CTERM sorting domain-containing protein [Burkholderiales bacterium]
MSRSVSSRRFPAFAAVARGIATVASAAMLFAASAPAMADAGIGAQVNFQSPLTVGQTNAAGFVVYTNTSDVGLTFTIDKDLIRLIPSCTVYAAPFCTTPDLGVFSIDSPATGAAGTACAGVSFTVTPTGEADGSVWLVPPADIVLGVAGSATASCRIDFTFDVLESPVDVSVPLPGAQTRPGTRVDGEASDGSIGQGFGTTIVTVNPTTPGLSTTASPTLAAPGNIYDTATLTGGVNPTGTITFKLYGPNDATCATAISTTQVTVNGNGAYQSANYFATLPGTYRWIASYSGDANNAAVSGACNDSGESVVVTNGNPSLTTMASPAVKLGNPIHDTATLSNGASPTGTITFNLYGPNDATCASTPIFNSVVAVNGNGNYPSANFSPTAPGTYRWIATYSGDANNNPIAGACNDPNESVVVSPATPNLSTTASPSSTTIGLTVTDSANLTGGYNPTGTVVFKLYGPATGNTCIDAGAGANLVFTSNPITVNGNGSYGPSTPAFQPTAPGTYRWIASYSGDANNDAKSGACGDANETVIVNKATPGLSTTASAGGVIGVSVTDSATLTGGYSMTGNLVFRLYGPSATNVCNAGNLVYTSPAITVNGPGNYGPSGSFQPTVAGTYRWRATYSGDANNASVTGACGAANESVTITKSSPSIATTASAGGSLGTQVTDSATLSGGSNPTGTITFRLYGPSATPVCTNLVFTSNAIAVNGNGNYGPSNAFTPTAAGNYYWIASYSGDTNNNPAVGACGATGETVTIDKTRPTIATTASAGGSLGTQVTDSATLSGGSSPTGSITFRLYGPSATPVCTNLVFTSNAVAVNGNGNYGPSNPYTPTAPGNYYWIASYSGDANNAAVDGTCGATGETVTIGKSNPTIATTASAGGPVGTQVTDSATLSGGSSPTGSITFRLYGPSATPVCTTLVFTSNAIAVNGNGNYGPSNAYAPTAPGNYYWIASYSGDANNSAVDGTCGATGETVTISKGAPKIVTSATAGPVKLGASISDQATLSDGVNPTGSITFVAYGPNDAACATPVFTSNAVAVNGNGVYNSAPAFTPTAVGTYRWIASYSGDANNNAVAGACNDPGESSVVTQATPAIATTASAGGTVGPTSVTDQATLTGGTNPTGSITFRLYGPDDATCANSPVFTSSPVAVNGNGIYTSPSFTPSAAGTYRWIASYSGDDGNAAVAGTCNDPGESVVLTKSDLTLVTMTASTVQLGTPIHDTATLAGGVNPTGNLMFRLYGPNDATCSNTPVFTSGNVAVNGNGSYASPSFTPNAIGTYRWIASYSGDANNPAISGACNDANESVAVIPVTRIPTLSEWGLLLMALMLGSIAVATLRRRPGR